MKKITFLKTRKVLNSMLVILFVMSFCDTFSQKYNFREIKITEPICVYHPDPEPFDKSKIEALRKSVNLTNSPCSNFDVTYIDFTPEAQAAFQHAVDIWSHIIESPVLIRIVARFEPLDENTLGSASPASFNTVSGVPTIDPNKWYPAALYEKLLGQDRGEFEEANDINTRFNSEFDFYFGLDGNPPSGKHDFVSVVLHELGHGLGFVGFANIDGLNGKIRSNNRASIYDNFIVNSENLSILSLPDPSSELFASLTSNNLFSNSQNAISGNNNILPKIYAPSEFNQGSSYSHWDEFVFPAGNSNSLMTPRIASGEANHNPGDITIGFFKDMGWGICSTLSIDEVNVSSKVNVWPNPFTDQISVGFTNLNSTKLQIKLFDIKGSMIFSKQITYDGNYSIYLNDLGSIQKGIYFMTITNTSSNLRFTEKIVKY
ncbi:T9SS type A sorting domain-containing protein [Polaribacter gangjinensis]|uniref:Secretion system C-terminal sorting domain-containing protein n=1 Tax=Polaribacter gangjinensis TaxID=574710 RepID=A0A2S7WCK3_9FLAO|nr:T9SS type A sorting domain-containing protein [Polaribacter gangjinensis]PQJ75136.1 hypothetical protein BTO13_07700 [Polaribacter gangjinensis]